MATKPPPPFESLPSDELLRELDALLAEINRRAENYYHLAGDSTEALDEGLLFVMKAERISRDRRFQVYEPYGLDTWRRWLEELSVGGLVGNEGRP
jgi:hypothetical protein